MLPGQRECAAQLGCDALSLALYGGEDYQLLFTADRDTLASRSLAWTVIGEVVPGAGVFLREKTGLSPLKTTGFDHFAVPPTR